MHRLIIMLIRAYQMLLSPFLASSCRYYPTCSEYAKEAIDQHGAFKGIWLAAKRLGRCHPLHGGGYDPVPATRKCRHDCNHENQTEVIS